MNRSRPHHKIYGWRSCSRSSSSSRVISPSEPPEGGYALVAMLAIMTVLALFALAAAPSIRQQSQREREKEAIFRGEQVADAIRSYYIYKRSTLNVGGDPALPTSVDQLLEGIPVTGGSKNRQILRASAARDPLSASGEWALVHPRTQKLIDFQRSVLVYSGNLLPVPRDPQMLELQGRMTPELHNVIGLSPTSPTGEGEDLSADSSGPFIGVVSRSRNGAVLYYYGIEQHNNWIFTPLFRW